MNQFNHIFKKYKEIYSHNITEYSREDGRDIFNNHSDSIRQILHMDRDANITQNIFECKDDIICAIVGISHMDNIIKNWDKLTTNNKDDDNKLKSY